MKQDESEQATRKYPTRDSERAAIRRRRVDRLRAWREWRNINQKQLAERAGLMPGTVSRVERGTELASVRTVEKLARGLGITVEFLLKYNPPEEPDEGQKGSTQYGE